MVQWTTKIWKKFALYPYFDSSLLQRFNFIFTIYYLVHLFRVPLLGFIICFLVGYYTYELWYWFHEKNFFCKYSICILSYLEIVNFPLLLSQISSQVQWIILCSTFWHWHKPVWLWTDGHFILEILTQFSFWQTSPTYSYRRTWYNIMVTGSMLSLGNEKKTVKRMLYKWRRQGKIQKFKSYIRM